MRNFPVSKYFNYVRTILDTTSDFSRPDTKDEDIKVFFGLADEAEEYTLFSVADQFRRIASELQYRAGALTNEEARPFVQELMNRLEDDSARHVVMMIEPDHVRYLENAQFFDPTDDPKKPKVSVNFPSAGEDISEAGKCLACGRGTACVMHLQRVMEVGLEVLAKTLGSGPKNDWGKYLEAIDKELQARMKASGARTPEEQFYAEAHATFDSVRRAWRNPSMHVDRAYTQEHAEEILIAARSFMRHLATRLSE